MKLLKEYLRQHRLGLGLYLLFGLIFSSVFALYGLPLAAVSYPAALCTLLGLGALGWDFLRTVEKHRQMERLFQHTACLTGELPATDTLEGADYRLLAELLRQERARFGANMEGRYQDMVDYYTVWAHQIKTPIASIQLHLQNEDTPLSRMLQSDLLRIQQYVDMVLVYLRLDSRDSDFLIREYDVDAIVRNALRKFSGEFIARKLRFRYESKDIRVITDEKWLSFVVEQVLSNALKYTAEGSIFVTLESPGTLIIRDTGIGIAPEDLPRIFEKGYTGFNGRLDKKATGLGLYLCRRICGKLGHTITAESELGLGTVIRIGLSREALEME